MWLIFSLVAAFLTSFLPIVNERLLADTPVSVIAWGVNALSLPLLGCATLILSPLPTVDLVFGLAGSAALNVIGTLVSTQALKWGDASLVTPLLTFNPSFTLLIAAIALGEVPTPIGASGVLVILAGAILLGNDDASSGRPFRLLTATSRSAAPLAIAASLDWGLTPVLETVAIQHTRPADAPLVAFGSTALMALLLLPVMQRQAERPLGHLAAHPRTFLLAAMIAGVAPVFGFTAIGLGLVGYVSAIFKLSALFSVGWAFLFLREEAAWLCPFQNLKLGRNLGQPCQQPIGENIVKQTDTLVRGEDRCVESLFWQSLCFCCCRFSPPPLQSARRVTASTCLDSKRCTTRCPTSWGSVSRTSITTRRTATVSSGLPGDCWFGARRTTQSRSPTATRPG